MHSSATTWCWYIPVRLSGVKSVASDIGIRRATSQRAVTPDAKRFHYMHSDHHMGDQARRLPNMDLASVRIGHFTDGARKNVGPAGNRTRIASGVGSSWSHNEASYHWTTDP